MDTEFSGVCRLHIFFDIFAINRVSVFENTIIFLKHELYSLNAKIFKLTLEDHMAIAFADCVERHILGRDKNKPV